MKLFSVPKVGLFCDGITHAIEKRRGEEVKIVTLALRMQPFDSKLAVAIDDGLVGQDVRVRNALFKVNHPDPVPGIRRIDFALGCERQNLTVYASPDTEAGSMCLEQVKIAGTYARSQKDMNGFAFCLKGSFGPLGRAELEFIQKWLLTQRFVTFEQAEPGMFDDTTEDDEDLADADEKARQTARPTPMWDGTDEEPAPAAEAPAEPKQTDKHKKDRANRSLHSHQTKKAGKGKRR